MADPKYSHDELRRVIHRATAIREDRGELLTEQDLRAIGEELGLDANSIDTAILEMRRQYAPSPVGRSQGDIIGVAVLTGTAAGLGSAIVHNMFGMHGLIDMLTPALVVVAIAEVPVALGIKGKWRLAKFQAVNLATWSGFGLGLMTSYYRLDAAAAAAILGAVVGTMVMASRELYDRYISKSIRMASDLGIVKPSTPSAEKPAQGLKEDGTHQKRIHFAEAFALAIEHSLHPT